MAEVPVLHLLWLQHPPEGEASDAQPSLYQAQVMLQTYPALVTALAVRCLCMSVLHMLAIFSVLYPQSWPCRQVPVKLMSGPMACPQLLTMLAHSLEIAPADNAPTDNAPADSAPADSAPADNAPADNAPADKYSSVVWQLVNSLASAHAADSVQGHDHLRLWHHV